MASQPPPLPKSDSRAGATAPAYKNPFLWVPTSYLTMGLVYVDGRQRREHHVQEHGDAERPGGVLVQHPGLPVHASSSCGRPRWSCTGRRSFSSC